VLFYAGIYQESEQKRMPQNTREARNINPFKKFQNMTKILFVCHGNICRSPMAEFVMKDLVKKARLENQFQIASAATSTEEIGNPVYPPARRKLAEHGISCAGKTARQLTKADYTQYDLLIGMDRANIRNMNRICGGDPDGKIRLLLDCTGRSGDVADPWYTGDFDAAWRDVLRGCQGLLRLCAPEVSL
jgi:protein-tyrosine phosphatase